ncbi:76_t:CDS:2, partial [Entrophospora sp. SA101]
SENLPEPLDTPSIKGKKRKKTEEIEDLHIKIKERYNNTSDELKEIISENEQVKEWKTLKLGFQNGLVNYDQWLVGISSEEMKKNYNNSSRILDWMVKYKFGKDSLKLLYGEAAGPPFQPSKLRTEYNRRKLIRYCSRNIRSTLDKIKLMHGNIINENKLNKVKKLPRICMLTHGTNLDLYYYDKSKNNFGVFIDLFSLPLPLTKHTSEKEVRDFLIGMVIFERAISSIQPAIKELNQSISESIDPTSIGDGEEDVVIE